MIGPIGGSEELSGNTPMLSMRVVKVSIRGHALFGANAAVQGHHGRCTADRRLQHQLSAVAFMAAAWLMCGWVWHPWSIHSGYSIGTGSMTWMGPLPVGQP